MPPQLPSNRAARVSQTSGDDVTPKLERSRQRLLDLTLRNRLLNFRPGNPDYRDDLKGHKHIGFKGHMKSLWQKLVNDEKTVEIAHLTRDQQSQLSQELLQAGNEPGSGLRENLSLTALGHEDWSDLFGSIRGVSQFLEKGNLLSLLPDEHFRKRLTKIRNEQNTLSNSTGDSALFLAVGFLEWCESEPHPKANEPLFAPLILVHINLDQKSTEQGGEREFFLQMDADQPQGNPCLAEKLRQVFGIDLPDIEDEEVPEIYFDRVRRAVRSKKNWKVNPTIALGFFNFARYRLWLDLDPDQWPEGKSPKDHPIVSAILNGNPLSQKDGIPSDDDVANHQASDDLPIVMDADGTQYATLLAGQKGVSLVVQGPPGSGKSQTITNLIAVAIAQGKRVLFVAQKLPALQVVRRRLESVELASFCLPLFSDKARVTEVHKHLANSVLLREKQDWQRPLYNQVVALAKKLNAHATRLREHPTGFNQSACTLIQRATALHLMLREAWGSEWHDELLDITVQDVEASPDWLEKREQTLHQWYRLKAEVGDAWANWTPLNLGAMDTQTVEAFIRHQKQAAASLATELSLLPADFHSVSVAKVEQLVAEIRKGRFTALKDVLPKLLQFLWGNPGNAAFVARLEHDLEEFHRQLSKAQKHFRLTQENSTYIATRATEALKAILKVVSPRCSLGMAKTSLEELNDLLRLVQDFSAFVNLNTEGIQAIWTGINPSTEPTNLTWKHVDILVKHNFNPNLSIPIGGKLILALYVQDDDGRKNEARALAQCLARHHVCLARLNSRVTDLYRVKSSSSICELEQSVRNICQHSLLKVRLSELSILEQTFLNLADSIRKFDELIPPGFCTDVFKATTLKIREIEVLATLADIPQDKLQIPNNGTKQVLIGIIGHPNPVNTLQSFSKAIESYQLYYQATHDWYPEVQQGHPVDIELLKNQREADKIITELGLVNQPLGSLLQLADMVEKLRKATQTLLTEFKNHFEPWPLLQPENIEQIVQAKNLFLLLISRPYAPAELSVNGLCVESNAEMVSAAITENRELQLFREQYSDRVIFRDLPEVETLTVLRRELRSFTGCWWRWFSKSYYKTLKKIREFLNSPYPSDTQCLALFDELETHERRRLTFLESPVGSVLGNLFQGIKTNWTAIVPTLEWIQLLKEATQSSDVVAFVNSAKNNTEGLRAGVKSIEKLTQFFDQYRHELSFFAPLSLLAANPEAVKIQALEAALVRTEKLINDLVGYISTQVKLKPKNTFNELIDQIKKLELLRKSDSVLQQFSFLAEPSVAVSIDTAALLADAAWLTDLTQSNVSPVLLEAMIGKKIAAENHWPLFKAAQIFNQQLNQAKEALAQNYSPAWLSPNVFSTDLKAKLSKLLQAISTARVQSLEWTFEQYLTIEQVQESFEDIHEIEAATKALIPWKPILHEDPLLLSGEQITATLDWLISLRQHGASGSLLQWLLTEETENRLHWWQHLVSRAKEIRVKIRKLQENFILPLDESQSTITLVDWSSQSADRNSQVSSALEIIETHCLSDNFTVQDLEAATAGLRRALELEVSLQSWHDRLGMDATHLSVARIQNHRQWTATVRGFTPSLANWLAEKETSSRSLTLLGIEPKLEALKQAANQTKDSMDFFGQVAGKGPFEILCIKGTCREIEQNCDSFTGKISLLPSYAALLRERANAQEFGLSNILTYGENASVSIEIIINTFRGAVAYQQAKSVWEADEELRFFQSNEHERLRKKFQEDDEKQLKTNRQFIKTRLNSESVTEGFKGRKVGEHTEYALLQWEMGKQCKHLPIRKLVNRAGRAMQDLCPCWMMTPLAVAQFLAPESINFDLVIMDEASQINPEDAWGAIARGQQLVVVGDQKQMPPSDFFMSSLEEDESLEEEDQIDGGKSESILGACSSSLTSSSLLWHYRSLHETLIAPANSFSYENRLILFPHPHRSHPELGIRYNFISNATTTTGKVINALEAGAIAARVRDLVLQEYAKPAEDRLTIGVVTMNMYQQDAIMDLLGNIRENDRHFDFAMTTLASEQNEEPLFVRNLENIQGDQRDIMIISCTYGPHTPGGTPAQRFGPLNRQGGERRFNVLITRAKCRMEIFSSIRSDQILVDGKQQGVRDFHLFLKYAESGVLADPGEATSKPADSPFEIQVEAVLQRAGFKTERQVGVAGYYIDLGVKHPNHPGLFALGVECDGKTYHSSRAARDRDRLREKVLMERGWKLHRIWSTDWFVNPIQAKKKLIDAVNKACM